MPKQKSNSGAKKRFSLKKSGKIKRAKMNRRHILTKKSSKRKRRLRQDGAVSSAESRRIKAALPYGL